MEASSIASASNRGATGGTSNDTLRGLDVGEFLDLMIVQLQNQDPLSPLENTEILQQISQIRSIDATNKLGATLDAVLLGQSLSNASALIGKQVRALGDDEQFVTGQVDRISIVEGQPRVHIGEDSFRLENIAEIKAA